ncbi:hypothetical protein TNCV_1360141 [Trichonephila clavipes]|nr:hypothetical protein TNCV_1360141 [Trichonephila clavipes]
METLGLLWIRFSVASRSPEVCTVRFHSLPGRRPSLPRYLKRQIASDNVYRGHVPQWQSTAVDLAVIIFLSGRVYSSNISIPSLKDDFRNGTDT